MRLVENIGATSVDVMCVQPEGAPALTLSWRKKEVVTTETTNTIADGVAGRFPIPEVLNDLVEIADDAILVSEESIIKGMRLLYEHAGLVVSSQHIVFPQDFLGALEQNMQAQLFFNTLSKSNVYAIAWRLTTAKHPETRKRRFDALLAMLERGEFH